jgi:hypothetical protein
MDGLSNFEALVPCYDSQCCQLLMFNFKSKTRVLIVEDFCMFISKKTATIPTLWAYCCGQILRPLVLFLQI